MQQALYEMALATPVEPHIRASCARAWSDLQERKRVLDGKPLPGQLRPDMPDKYRRKHGVNAQGKPVTLLSTLPADPPPAEGAQ